MSPSEKTEPRAGSAGQAATARQVDLAAGAPRPTAATAPSAAAPARGSSAGSPAPAPASSAQPSAAASSASSAPEGPRRVRLSLAHVNTWSVAKLAFLLSVALGIVLVVAVALLWSLLDAMGVFSQLDGVIRDVVGTESSFRVSDVLGLSRVLSVAVFVAVVDVVLLTLLSTVAALLYNLASGLVGGVRLTLSDD